MANINYQGIVADKSSSKSSSKSQVERDNTLYTLRMPPGTTLSPKMVTTPKISNVPSKLADMADFLSVQRCWYRPSYPTGKGCSIAHKVTRDKDGNVEVTASLYDFTSRKLSADFVIANGTKFAPVLAHKPPRKNKSKPTAETPQEAPIETPIETPIAAPMPGGIA